MLSASADARVALPRARKRKARLGDPEARRGKASSADGVGCAEALFAAASRLRLKAEISRDPLNDPFLIRGTKCNLP